MLDLVIFVLWMTSVGVLPMCILATARREWRHEDVCAKCQYSLTGLGPGAACPECGSGERGRPRWRWTGDGPTLRRCVRWLSVVIASAVLTPLLLRLAWAMHYGMTDARLALVLLHSYAQDCNAAMHNMSLFHLAVFAFAVQVVGTLRGHGAGVLLGLALLAGAASQAAWVAFVWDADGSTRSWRFDADAWTVFTVILSAGAVVLGVMKALRPKPIGSKNGGSGAGAGA